MDTNPANEKVVGYNNPLPTGWGDGYNSDSTREIIYYSENHQDTDSDIAWA